MVLITLSPDGSHTSIYEFHIQYFILKINFFNPAAENYKSFAIIKENILN